MEQAKGYCRRLHVPFVFSSNGHLFVEFDDSTGKTTAPRPLTEFPGPAELMARWESVRGVNLESNAARPLVPPYSRAEVSARRYYLDAA
jgi:type I restriction enzyme R subunit